MGRACIINTNNIGLLLAEYLKTSGRIADYEIGNDARVCFEFNGTLTITFEDYMNVHPLSAHINRFEVKLRREKLTFNRYIQSEIIRTLRAGEVVEYFPGDRITIKCTERTEVVCVRLTKEEKEKLEEEANKVGVTISDLIRSKLFP